MELPDKFLEFEAEVSGITLPEKFNYPFYYEPHLLSVLASEQIQRYLETQKNFDHNFGLDETQDGLVIGKMFGVLVVRSQSGKLGFLAAFSGKLGGENHHELFVPPVYDILDQEGFFRVGEQELNEINLEIETLENDPVMLDEEQRIRSLDKSLEEEIFSLKRSIKENKEKRKLQRAEAQLSLSGAELADYLEELRQTSVKEQIYLKYLIQQRKVRMRDASEKLLEWQERIQTLKELRKRKSANLQERIFKEYSFLNAEGKDKSLLDIFQKGLGMMPPAGAGECAAPKLLHYAYSNKLEPIALAEFWWGESPPSEVRKHKQFYPSCRGKCEPILSHMLKGLDVEENPMTQGIGDKVQIEVLYEDDQLMVINKPAELLSVPGIHVEDSVYSRMRKLFPNATGPLIVHRLDLSTSGIMLIAKDMDTYHHLQRQFMERTVYKRYVAVLEGLLETDSGEIDLPLRVDLENRPRQLVCYEFGKPALTHYRVIERREGRTRIHFFPKTGRSHQLRVHASHHSGLGMPILGDDIYGNKADRLHLHADKIVFIHPLSGRAMTFKCDPDF